MTQQFGHIALLEKEFRNTHARNADDIVDIFDITTVALAFNSIPGDSNWNPVTDINFDRFTLAHIILLCICLWLELKWFLTPKKKESGFGNRRKIYPSSGYPDNR